MLNTVNSVRVLLCQISNQILYQRTPILSLPCRRSSQLPLLFAGRVIGAGPPLEVFLLVSIRCLMKRLARDFGFCQHFVELIVANAQHFNCAAFTSADRSTALAMMEKCDFTEVFARTQLCNDHIRLVYARQDDLHSAFRHNIEL